MKKQTKQSRQQMRASQALDLVEKKVNSLPRSHIKTNALANLKELRIALENDRVQTETQWRQFGKHLHNGLVYCEHAHFLIIVALWLCN